MVGADNVGAPPAPVVAPAAAVKLSLTPSNAAFRAKLTKFSVQDEAPLPLLFLSLLSSAVPLVLLVALLDLVADAVEADEALVVLEGTD